jgi:TM2 domain-containing membrane protein YozV
MSMSREQSRSVLEYEAQRKSVMVAYVLWFFLWFVAGHRFYAGKPLSAILQLLLHAIGWATAWLLFGYIFLAVWGVWWVIDALLIPGWIRDRNMQIVRSIS